MAADRTALGASHSHVSAALSTEAAHPHASTSATTRGWRESITKALVVNDLAVLLIVVFGTQVVWLGVDAAFRDELPYWLISAVIVLAWWWSLGLADSRAPRILGSEWTEYLRVISASLRLFGAIAVIAYLSKADIARGYLLLSLPIGMAALLLSRVLWRKWLLRRRGRGAYSARTLLVGTPASVSRLARALSRSPHSGFTPVGACVPSGVLRDAGERSLVQGTDLRMVGDFGDVVGTMRRSGADTVVIASADEISSPEIKRISWALEAGRQHLVLAAGISDIAGPRMHIRPVAGLSLIHVETPTFSHGQRFAKRTMDVIASACAIVILSPVLLLLALLVRMTSKGPALFKQERVGLHGRRFKMVKFRSMVVDAEQQLDSLRAQQEGLGNEVLFKMRDDPRVTKIGHFMRRYSLDELPQFFNVLAGSMSLIGPRPPLPSEVDQYDVHVHRRFLMKPGITGPWQVGGRSTLSWEDSVRLDLSYVENWSLANDVLILFKTVRVVLAPGDTSH